MTATYLLKIEQDHDAERPDAGGLGRMVSFNTSHLSYEEPTQWVTSECPVCGGDGWQGPDKGYGPDDVECKNCEGEGRIQKMHRDVLATLSYFEHGLEVSLPGMKSRVQRGRKQLKDAVLNCCEVQLDGRNVVSDYQPKQQCGDGDC